METAEVVKIGDTRLVELPKDFNTENDEVVIRRIGKILVLAPKNEMWDIFMDGINGFTDDFFPNGREVK